MPLILLLNFSTLQKADYGSMCDFLLDWDFSACLNSSDVSAAWDLIKSAINVAVDKFVPVSTTTRCFGNSPKWFDQSIRHKINCHRTLQRIFRSHPSPLMEAKVSISSDNLNYDIAQAKSSFIAQLHDDKTSFFFLCQIYHQTGSATT
uniref:Uncharacterized protein n=1 Tax=Amphimedon queenslandica TaxID=400682 RepID=A0A1X7VSN5_AMPQE